MDTFVDTDQDDAKNNQSKPIETQTEKRRNNIMDNNIKSDKSGNGNKDLAHLTFEEYFEGDWRKHFQEKDTIQNILDAAGLSGSHEFVQINSRYLIDDNRMAIIALLRRKDTEVLDKIIIDVIAGNSSFEQFFDVVYNIGSDCDYRMIICDWNSKNEAPGAWMTDNIMCALINVFEHHLFLYWISADSLRDWEGNMKVIFTVIESAAKSDHSSNMPGRRDLEYAELCCYTWQASGYFSSQDECHLQFNSYYEDEAARTEWLDEGIITEVDMDEDDYTWLFTERTEDIKHDDCSYEYDKEKGILTITKAIPFQNFKNSLPEEKSDLADGYYGRARIGSWIDELLREKEDEEKDDNPSIAADSSNKSSLMEMFRPAQEAEFMEPEPIELPSVLEFLGTDWKEYFCKPEAINEIIRSISFQDELRAFRRRSMKGKVEGVFDDRMAYDFVEISSITHLGDNRQRIIASFRDIRNGLIEKWSLDIISSIPSLDQFFYALYDSEDDCARRLILYFEDLLGSNEPNPEIKVEKDVLSHIIFEISDFTDRIYPIQLQTTYSDDKESNVEIFFFNHGCLSGGRQGKIPPRSIFESKIWDIHYNKVKWAMIKDRSTSKLVTELYNRYSKVPFYASPEWTEKGLFLRLIAAKGCPETNWLIKNKKDELARRYPGCEVKVDMEPGTHYCILIQLHSSPVTDFVESTTKAKLNYVSEIHKQQLELMHNVEDIFQDYAPKTE